MFTSEDEARYQAALVRFYRANTTIVGAGILVAEQYVLTCAHVLTRSNTAPESVSLDFPCIASGQKLTGVVIHWQPERDIAGIRLLEPAPTNSKPLPLRPSSNYINHQFRVYGFPEKQSVGGWALGSVVGNATEELVQIQGEMEQGYGIEPGFSGAPVWDEALGGVIGLARLRDKDRPSSKVGFMIPFRQLITALKAGESVSLLALLEPYEADIQKSIEGAYRVCRPEGSLEPIPKDLWDKLQALTQMPDGATGYPALQRFVACLTLGEFPVPLELSSKLRQWLSSREVEISKVLKAIAPSVKTYLNQISEAASPHLLIWLNAHNSGDTYPVEALFIPDRREYDPKVPKGFEPIPAMAQYDTPIPLSQLPEVLRACLADCADLCPNITTLTIELFLPFALLHRALEWEAAYEVDELAFLEPEPIGLRYQFVVRSSERLLKEYERAQCLAFWKNKWQAFDTLLQASACDTLLLADDQTSLRQLQVNLKASDKVGLKILNCPTKVASGNPLKALLSSGSPTAIWVREKPAQIDCPREFEALLGCCIQVLPEHVQQARQAAYPLEKDAHIGHHLSLVWEDPNLVPPLSDDLAS